MYKIRQILVVAGFLVVGLMVIFSPLEALAANSDLTAGMTASRPADTPTDASDVFKTITNILFFLIGAISVIMLIYGGIRYTTSGGNAKSIEAAKQTVLYSIIGLVVAILAYAIVNFVVTNLSQ